MFPCWEKLSWSRSDGRTSLFPVFSSTTSQSHFWGADLICIPRPFSFCWNWSHCSRSGSENPSTTSSDPPRLIQSLPSPAHNIYSLGCHLTARCGYSVLFTVVSNHFVWFSQLDWKAFGSRPCLPWDSMTQWFVCGELLHTDDHKERLTRLCLSSRLSGYSMDPLETFFFFLKFLAS